MLNTLEITNFKSYRGTHTVGPLDRFSCIVGPNGSGKSNILDALTFVLNVPNTFLRVKNLKNLIEYSSSEASVKATIGTITFERKIVCRGSVDNDAILDSVEDDHSMIRENQSTISKYYVNGEKISQKDYNTELEKLNILSKIKNFVIYQGDIIKSDVDLLKMIENASGSEAYIEEYEMLQDKIAVMSKGLSVKYERRRDCHEMMKEMKEVKEKEKTFQSLITQKDEIQAKIYTAEINNKNTEILRIKDAIKTLEGMKDERKYNEIVERVNKIRSEAARLQKEYFEKETEISFEKSRQGGQRFDWDGKRAELKELSEGLERLREELGRLQEPLDLKENAEFERELKEKEQEYVEKTKDLERELAEITLVNFDKINKRDQLKSKIRQVNAQIGRIKTRNIEIERENKMKLEKLASIEREIQNLESRVQDKVNAYENVLSDGERLNRELNDVTREILLNKAKKNDATRRSVVKNTVETLKTIFSGVHGRLIDLVEPIQKKYETGIGVLLARHDQSVVVENEKTALDCLRYIKDTKACKLTFLPLNKIRGPSISSENIENAGIFGGNLARNCIRHSPEYEEIVGFVLRNSLVVDTVPEAKDILYGKGYKGSICTLDGVLFSPNGLITGGRAAVNKFEEDAIDRLLTKRKTILEAIRVNKDRKEAFSDVAAIKMKIDELKDKKSGIKIERLEFPNELDTRQMENELCLLEEALGGFEDRQKQIKEAKKEIERMVFGSLLRRIGIGSLGEYRERLRQDYRRQELLIRQETIKDKMAILTEELSAQEKSNKEKMVGKDIRVMEVELGDVQMRLENTKERLRAENDKLRVVSEKRNQVSASIVNHQLHLVRVEEDLKDVMKYAELEAIGNVKGEGAVLDLPTLRAKLEEINQLIAQNAPTVSATDSSIVAKFTRLNREYEIAKEELLMTKREFQEVKGRRMGTFTSCFSVVSQEIPEIYRELTRGGMDVNSYLVFEGDPFINNVKYYLMPPMKRFVPFHELSGGEKSIALLSFIFALSKYRRPPFYIFDEVDSALDKMNVDGLARYILTSGDQFLVVSLKPQFFSQAESLFGVYKPPEGGSRVLSIKLSSCKE